MKKRIIAMILAAAMTMSVGACGKEGDKGSSKAGDESVTEQIDPKEVTFRISDDVINYDGVEGDIEGALRLNDKIILNTYQWVENTASGTDADKTASAADADDMEEDGNSYQRLYIAPLEGGTAQKIYEVNTEESYLEHIFTGDGNFYVTKVEYSSEGYVTEKATLIELDENGKELSQKDASYLYKNSDDDSYLSAVRMSKSGNLIAVYDRVVKVFDTSGKEISSTQSDNWIMGCCLTKDGDVLILTSGEEGKMVAKIVNETEGGFTKEYPMKTGYLSSPDWLYTGEGDYDFFYKSEAAFFGYNLDENKETRICDFAASDINTSYMYSCIMIDEKTILSVGYNWDEEVPIIEKYVKVDPSEVVDKKELTIMCYWTNSDLRQDVINFNKAHSDIRINIIDYSDEENPGEKMSADIAAGKIPDMYYITDGIGNMSMDQVISKGMLEDLTPYIDKDPEISTDDFVPSVLNAIKKDGKLYYVASSFNINALFAKGSDVEGKDGWTFEEMKEYVDSKPNSRLFETTKKEDMLETFLYCCGADFVDWEKGECYFNTPAFKSLLELCNRGDDQEVNYEEMTMTSDIRSGKQLFMIGYVTPDEMQMYKEFYNKDLAVIGYPNVDRQGVYVDIDGGLAMSTKCSDKEAAWSFIRTVMTKEYQGRHYSNDMTGCPTRSDVLEMYFKAKQTTEEYTDEFGNTIYPVNGEWGWDDLVVTMKPLTDEEVQEYRDIINRISKTWDYDESLNEIISEEAKAYFAGDKTVDETCEIIQNRATTYVKESK